MWGALAQSTIIYFLLLVYLLCVLLVAPVRIFFCICCLLFSAKKVQSKRRCASPDKIQGSDNDRKKIISRKACCLFLPRGKNFFKIELDTLERAQGEGKEWRFLPFLFLPRNPQTFSPLEVKREKEEGDPGDGFVPGDLLHHPLLLSFSHPLFPSFCFLPRHVRGS